MKSVRVLLVDDEEGFSSVLAKRLSRRAVDVSTALCGEEALHRLETHDYQVVVLDMKMPGMNGLEVLRIIKTEHPQVEVIVLTGNTDMKSALASMTAGAFDLMLKPANTEILINRIVDAARQGRIGRDEAV
ncbi:response regulator [Desulfovibrio sp. JC022]|uniref:response regulator n=1 Tax=Desulfovibrio sp. JC022 TaxID=2593642 RepID=UPI0013D38413|nr:response regulator [Desulfovibrio sp. JC022]NDV22710.1 response regulator [Desulfovibrio sp. JC022]